MRVAGAWSALVCFGLAFCSPTRQESTINPLESYLALQEALAGDDYQEASVALQSLIARSSGELKALAEEAAKAPDLDSIRDAFKPLSNHVVRMELEQGYVVAFCPMADGFQGAQWVQKKGEIRNPYFGSSMLHCGSVVQEAKN